MFSSFLSDVLVGNPIALFIVAVCLGVIAYAWPTVLKYAKERAEIAQYNKVAETADLESRFARRDIHPEAVPAISLKKETTRIELDADRQRMNDGLDGG